MPLMAAWWTPFAWFWYHWSLWHAWCRPTYGSKLKQSKCLSFKPAKHIENRQWFLGIILMRTSFFYMVWWLIKDKDFITSDASWGLTWPSEPSTQTGNHTQPHRVLTSPLSVDIHDIISKNDFWTPRLVLIHSEFVHPWDEVFRQSLVIPDYKYKPHVVLFLRCFQDFSSECIDAYMSGNLDLEQLLIIMYITGWDQHVRILFLWGCWTGLCQLTETQGREMPQKLWMLNDAGSQAFCLQLRPPLHVLGLGSWYVQAGLL